MKLIQNKLLLAVTIVAIVTIGLLVAIKAKDRSANFWPELVFESENNEEFAENDFIVEKITQKQQNSSDMRSGLYLTNHRYLLESIAQIEVKFRQNSYSLNDVCFKPHTAIFENFENMDLLEKEPQYIQRLFLEMRRLSPCLISTPLNCFYDGYKIHSKISKWNSSTAFLNRRLRNSYIDNVGENEARPYVKADSGPELIEGWANHMLKLSKSEEKRKLWTDNVKTWISSIQPRQKMCADPNCRETLDAENYFNICTVMQRINDYAEQRRQKLKFEFENSDSEFITQLDCVDDRDKFIEWMQERELRGILKTLAPEFDIDRQMIVNQRCDGIYHDDGSEGVEFFDGWRNFGNETSIFDSLRAEVVLMSPEALLKTLRHSDFVNGFESVWTIERCQELLNEFRTALRETVEENNESKPSKKIGVSSRVVSELPEEDSLNFTWETHVYFILITRAISIISFSVLVWSNNPVKSCITFAVRDMFTVALFAILCKTNGILILDSSILHYIALQTIVNLFLTTRQSFCSHRLSRCIQRSKAFDVTSNFSSLGTVDTLHEADQRQLQYILARYTKFQVAQDAYSKENFEKLPKAWFWISLFVIPIVGLYYYFVDPDCIKICVIILPSFAVAVAEELYSKHHFTEQRKMFRARQQYLRELMQKEFTRESVDNLFSGNGSGGENVSEKKSLTEEQSIDIHGGKLMKLSQSTYDVSQIMVYPNQMSRRIRHFAVSNYFRLLKYERLGVLILSIAILMSLIAVGLLFVPISRESSNIESAKCDDLFVAVEFDISSSNWDDRVRVLKQFSEEMESVETLRVVSNWQNSFERFEQRWITINKSSKSPNLYSEWFSSEPISTSITASKIRPDERNRLPNPFRFQLRYEFSTSGVIVETVQKVDSILSKYSKNMSLEASGALYEHYHRNDVVWNRFALTELVAAAILFTLFTIVALLFAVTATIKSALLFAFFIVATRLEISAVVSLLSLDHSQFYSNSAVFFAFFASWTPFCDLSRFRRRVLYKAESRKTPELATKRRVRVPFIAAVDVTHFFGILIFGCVLTVIVTLIVPEFHVFFQPSAIFTIIQLLALFNSIAVSAGSRKMLEHRVRQSIRTDLRGASTSIRICHLTQKLLTPPYEEPAIELRIIQPSQPQSYWAPPPKYPDNRKKRQCSEEPPARDDDMYDDEEDDPNVPGPSNRVRRTSEPNTKKSREGFVEDPDHGLYATSPWHYLIAGQPIDGIRGFRQSDDDPIARYEDYYESGEEEELNSSGEADEEVLRVEQEYLERWRAQQAVKNGGPSTSAPPPPPSDAECPIPPAAVVQSQPPPECSIPIAVVVQPQPPPELPRFVQRDRPRDPRVEPPIMEEFIQDNEDPNLPPHPRANQYPAEWDRAMVAYAEDPFWTERTVPIPPGIPIPERPRDFSNVPDRTPPPEDFEYVLPAGTPPIPIPQEALDLREERRRENERGPNPDLPNPD